MNSRAKTGKGDTGHLFIVSAPSGAGKTTLCTAVMQRFPDLRYSISHTTRPPRPGETHGVDYFFLDRNEFEQKIKQHYWAEWAKVHGHYYGTSAKFLDDGLSRGKDILLDIDVQGTRQILKRYPDSVTIFIMPPSPDILRTRLEARGTDSREAIERRLATAKAEMAQRDLYRHIIVNDELSAAVERLSNVIAQYRSPAL